MSIAENIFPTKSVHTFSENTVWPSANTDKFDDIPYIFDELEDQEESASNDSDLKSSKEKSEIFPTNYLHEYKENFYKSIKETSDYIENMIDTIFLEKTKKYFEESLKEKKYNQQSETAKNLPILSALPNLSQENKENRENMDPQSQTPLKIIKVETQNQEPKVLSSESPKQDVTKEIEINKRDKVSLLARIQNSLKDLTSYTNEKTFQQEITNNEERSKESLEVKQKANQLNSLLNIKKITNVKSIFLQNKKKATNTEIRHLLKVTKTSIKYGNVLPGYIMEDDLEIHNISSHNLSFRVNVICHNSELDDHDEYIYSIRKLNVYDYNEKITGIIPPNNTLKYKIALKVPNLKNMCNLKGSVIISVQGIESTINIPITSFVEIPEIFCPKEIFDRENICSVIKFALKKGKKQDCKIPFKNNSEMNLTLEFEFLEPENKKNGYDLINYPNIINIAANGIGILNVILKPILNSSQNDHTDNLIRRILLGKIKNSSMIYYFPLSIEIY